MFGDRPVHRAVGFDPDHDAAPGRVLRLRLRAAARRAGRSFGLVHDDVAPGMGFASSPHGASQTIFRPGISGVPDDARDRRRGQAFARMRGARKCDGAERRRSSEAKSSCLRRVPVTGPCSNTLHARLRRADIRHAAAFRARAPAAAPGRRSQSSCGRPSWRRRAHGRRPRSGGRGTRPSRGSIARRRSRPRSEYPLPTHCSASARQTSSTRRAIIAPSRSVEDGSTMQNSSPPVRASMSPGRRRVCAIRVKCCRQASPAAWPWVSLMALKPSRSITSSANGLAAALRARAFLRQALQQMAAVADAGEIVEQRQIGDLVAQPVHRHQQEAEIQRHRQEHQHQDHDRLRRAEMHVGESAADAGQRAEQPARRKWR